MEVVEKNKNADAEAQGKKLSYEQLENVAHQLSEQNNQLYQKLQQANMTNVFKRLDYLFKVVENALEFPSEFREKRIDEIMSLMNIDESEKEEESNEKA